MTLFLYQNTAENNNSKISFSSYRCVLCVLVSNMCTTVVTLTAMAAAPLIDTDMVVWSLSASIRIRSPSLFGRIRIHYSVHYLYRIEYE